MYNVSSHLDQWERDIFNNLEDFEKVFCHGEELISVSWNSATMKVNFLLKCGQHVCDSFPIERWIGWRQSLFVIVEVDKN